MIHMAWLAVSSFENNICVILSNISFSAFKEDEGKYKAVPQQERNVNALDFFKWSLVLAPSLFILIINLLFSVYHIWKIISYLRFWSWNWPTWRSTRYIRKLSRSQTSDMKMIERTHRLTKGHLQYLLFGSRADHQIWFQSSFWESFSWIDLHGRPLKPFWEPFCWINR